MQIAAYLNYPGTCREAFQFYAKCLGGTLGEIFTFGNSPMKDQTPPDWHNKVLHVTLTTGNSVLMGSDAAPQHYKTPQGFTVAINLASVEQGDLIFKALSEGGTVTMPFGKTFWSAGFGAFVDRYGQPWMINCDPASQPA
jgi:PhnB protein